MRKTLIFMTLAVLNGCDACDGEHVKPKDPDNNVCADKVSGLSQLLFLPDLVGVGDVYTEVPFIATVPQQARDNAMDVFLAEDTGNGYSRWISRVTVTKDSYLQHFDNNQERNATVRYFLMWQYAETRDLPAACSKESVTIVTDAAGNATVGAIQ